MASFNSIGLVLVVMMVILALSADFFLKTAGEKKVLFSWEFLLGVILYAFTAFVWFYALKNLKFSTANLFYSIFTILLSVAIGVFHFREHLIMLDYLAIAMAIGSIVILARFG